MNQLLNSILKNGSYSIISGFREQARLTEKAHATILSAIEQVLGYTIKSKLLSEGLQNLHKYLPAEDIGKVRDIVMPILRKDLFQFTCEIGEYLLEIQNEFFIDDYTILRVNYPYEVGLRSSLNAENPGIGRVDSKTREMKSSTQKKDERYDPKSYHKHTPPASWAHGPHKDTWTGHSRNGINIWWAISDVVEENSMIFFPDTFHKTYHPDPRSLYVSAGYPMSKPNKMALHSGEMLIFNPEILHATHLNTSQFTRIALSTRINTTQPKFDPSCFYAREFWHSSIDIKNGDIDTIRQFKRDENLEDAPVNVNEIIVKQIEYTPIKAHQSSDSWDVINLSDLDNGTDRHLIELSNGQQIALFDKGNEWKAVQLTCPHLDTNLLDGYCNETHVYCPAHGVAYELNSGTSSCSLLRLKTYEVEKNNNVLQIRSIRS